MEQYGAHASVMAYSPGMQVVMCLSEVTMYASELLEDEAQQESRERPGRLRRLCNFCL